MKNVVLLSFMFLLLNQVFGQDSTKVYNPLLDGSLQIKEAVLKATKEKKHVFVQIGGNWCPWCIKFNKFCKADRQIDSILTADYVVMHLNHSKGYENYPILKSLDYPQRFGFPVFVILNSVGKRIHTQNSSYVELDKGYDKAKVVDFLKGWNRPALDPKNYK